MASRIYGSASGLFGQYEWTKLLHVETLFFMLVAAFATWALAYLVPIVEGWGGIWATAVAVALPVVRAWLFKQSDNTDKFIRTS